MRRFVERAALCGTLGENASAATFRREQRRAARSDERLRES
jgi:hypothetical protein